MVRPIGIQCRCWGAGRSVRWRSTGSAAGGGSWGFLSGTWPISTLAPARHSAAGSTVARHAATTVAAAPSDPHQPPVQQPTPTPPVPPKGGDCNSADPSAPGTAAAATAAQAQETLAVSPSSCSSASLASSHAGPPAHTSSTVQPPVQPADTTSGPPTGGPGAASATGALHRRGSRASQRSHASGGGNDSGSKLGGSRLGYAISRSVAKLSELRRLASSHAQSLQALDETLGLRSQLFMAALTAVFVLYPSW